MFLDRRLIRRKVNTVHLVTRDIAMEPLNVRAHAFQDADRFLREFPPLRVGQSGRSRNLAFDYKLGHRVAGKRKP